jgi:hypothetical protein
MTGLNIATTFNAICIHTISTPCLALFLVTCLSLFAAKINVFMVPNFLDYNPKHFQSNWIV